MAAVLQLLTSVEQRIAGLQIAPRPRPESPRQPPPITTPQHDHSDGITATPCDSDDNHSSKDLQGSPEFCEKPEDSGKVQTTTQQHPESENDLLILGLPETAEKPENKEKSTNLILVYYPTLAVNIQFSKLSFPVKALIDTGATSCSISQELAEKLGWQLKPGDPFLMYIPDGTALKSNKIVSAQFTMGADKHRNFQMVAKVCHFNHDVVLGLSWLRQNRFKINTVKRTLEQSDYSVRCVETINNNDLKNPLNNANSPPGPGGAIEDKGRAKNSLPQHNDSDHASTSPSEPGGQSENKGKSQTSLLIVNDAILTVELQFNELSFPVQALIDTGCNGCILHPEIAANIGSKILPGFASDLFLCNGTRLQPAGSVFGEFSIGANRDRKFKVIANILPIGGPWQCILGVPWLRQNGFIINPMARTLEGPDYTIRCSINKGRFSD